MVTDRNYWATYRDPVAYWVGKLPPPAKLGMERLFEFARHILDTAEREQVMRVIGVPALPPSKNEDELSWFELGGTWGEPDVNPSDRPMVHRGGILLDYPAASA